MLNYFSGYNESHYLKGVKIFLLVHRTFKIVPHRYFVPILIFISAIQYSPTLFFGYTGLDDFDFIILNKSFNYDLHNLLKAFVQSVFNDNSNLYYRPLFVDSILLNYQLCHENLVGYHLVNIILHCIGVSMFYALLKKIETPSNQAFLIAIIFSVHPALCQAVAWIPGRNDTLLAVFGLAFLCYSIDYCKRSSVKAGVLSVLVFMLALFTKETAVVLPVLAVVIMYGFVEEKLSRGNLMKLLIACAVVLAFYFFMFFSAKITVPYHGAKRMLTSLIVHLPVLVQYLGKTLFPFNLCVYPIQRDTTYMWGTLALILISFFLFKSPEKEKKKILTGFCLFILMLFPVLLLPNTSQNLQVWEHRLYLPIMLFLIILPNTIVFKNNSSRRVNFLLFLSIVLQLSFINFQYQQNFANATVFWRSAVKSSPHSVVANYMAAEIAENENEANVYFQKAIQINGNAKTLNLRYGAFLLSVDSPDKAKEYIKKEMQLFNPPDGYFYLAKLSSLKHDTENMKIYFGEYMKLRHMPDTMCLRRASDVSERMIWMEILTHSIKN